MMYILVLLILIFCILVLGALFLFSLVIILNKKGNL